MSHNTITRELVYHEITDRTTIQTPTFVMQPKLDHSNTDWETRFVVRQTGGSRHNGGPIKDPLKPINTSAVM